MIYVGVLHKNATRFDEYQQALYIIFFLVDIFRPGDELAALRSGLRSL
jgi:hypothetical protein